MERKTMLYKTGVEYGDYTLNHIQGCSHGCKYPCYAYLLKKRFGIVKSYDEWIKPSIVENTLELLDKEIPKLKAKIKSVHLCFTTDPFMYGYDDIKKLSLDVIRKLNDNGIKVTVLTKGLLSIVLAEMSKDNEYGITLVSLNEGFRKAYEPNTAPFTERIESLKALHDKGFKTWVSIEPYPTPNIIEQDIVRILTSVSFADKIIFGRTNYSKNISAYKNHKQFYNEQSSIVIDFCEKRNIAYHIKKRTIPKTGGVLMRNEVFLADCMDYMATLSDNAFNLAIVDPPYGKNISYNMGRRKENRASKHKKIEWDDKPPSKEYFDELLRVSKNQIIWGGNYFIDKIPYPSSCWVVWNKRFAHEVSFATCELAWTSFTSPIKMYTYSPLQQDRIHPTQKPVEVYKWLLQNYAKPGDKILDTHVGSGSIRIACNDFALEFIGCEKDCDHWKAQEVRYKAYVAQLSLFKPDTEQMCFNFN